MNMFIKRTYNKMLDYCLGFSCICQIEGGNHLIELKSIDKVYEDGFQALKDINLEFEDGKINVLIGPSGCGKTTTMKLLNRLVEYTNGQVVFNGSNIRDINPIELRRQIGFVIQNIGLFPHMTIYNNVATVPKLLKWDKDKIHDRVTELLKMVNLDPDIYMDRYPSELSGGQQQRIGVIRALAAEPSTVLMDEPFSALDPISREQLQNELLNLQSNINKTIIFVTHDMDEALKIADQIILMKDGKIVQKGPPQEILDNPADDFVKEFIGEKRLQTPELPNLMKLIDHQNYVRVTPQMSNEKMVAKLVQQNMGEAIVVDDADYYAGTVSLYDALADKSKSVNQLLKKSTTTILNTDMTKEVLSKVENPTEMVPVLSEDGKVAGVLNSTKLFKYFYEMTDGDQ